MSNKHALRGEMQMQERQRVLKLQKLACQLAVVLRQQGHKVIHRRGKHGE